MGYFFFFIPVIFVILFDQITKLLAVVYLPGQVVPIIPGFLFLNLQSNAGIFLGFFQDYSPLGFIRIFLSLVILFFLVYTAFRAKGKFLVIDLGLIAGGIFSNLVDYIFRGRVIDFLDSHFGSFIWPTFNLADVSIVVGICLAFKSIIYEKENIKKD